MEFRRGETGMKKVEDITVMVTPDCPHAAPTVEMAIRTTGRLLPGVPVRTVSVTTPEEAAGHRFPGSPTIRVDGVDMIPGESGESALACRLYPGGHGQPPEWMLEAAILRALQPRNFLFLCVANSARSQMAEALARHLAPADVRVSSAGSRPAEVNPLALNVLTEIGIDAGNQYSKGLEAIDPDLVDVVITLCADEICPTFNRSVCRLHWGLPDPAAAAGSECDRLAAFRAVRNQLAERLEYIFPGF